MSELEKLLNEEKGLVVRFLDALRKEQAALVDGDAAVLRPISDAKLKLVEQLNHIEVSRSNLTSLPGSIAGKNGMLQWLDQHPEEKNCRALWLKIMSLARVARQMHAMNGELISMHLAKTSEALSILVQKQKDVSLYGSNGQSDNGTGSRIVDSA
jgi:flagellar biosynthesis protein FlgN